MSYPFEAASTKEAGISLWVLERHEWEWRGFCSGGYMRRSKLAAKCAALIAHDRILNGELLTRGLPSFYGGSE